MYKGKYTLDKEVYSVYYTPEIGEVVLTSYGTDEVRSAYKQDNDTELLYKDYKASELYKEILTKAPHKKKVTRGGKPKQTAKGIVMCYSLKTKGLNGSMMYYNSTLEGIQAQGAGVSIDLAYTQEAKEFSGIKYIPLAVDVTGIGTERRRVRTLEAIGLKKDISWLSDVDYKVVNDTAELETLFTQLENYDGEIAFDTETTGLHINMFCKLGSRRKAELEQLHSQGKYEDIQVDSLVGIIFSTQEKTGYYIPCGNREFANAYSEPSEVRDRIIQECRERYTNPTGYVDEDMQRYWRETPDDLIPSDVLLMERCRKILETKYIVTQGGKFDWKVCYNYGIDLNIKDDSMILHQVLYQTMGGEHKLSGLKHLTKLEFGIDQLSLEDCFIGYKEKDDDGKVHTKQDIDFSYMPYDLVQAYGPADGDMTLRLYHKYKADLLKNYSNQQYIIGVETIIIRAIAYMEYYGHMINEHKLGAARINNKVQQIQSEHTFRQLVYEFRGKQEQEQETKYITQITELDNERQEKAKRFADLIDETARLKSAYKFNNAAQLNESDILKAEEEQSKAGIELDKATARLIDVMSQYKRFIEVTDYINTGSSEQMCNLFYDELQIKAQEKRSVAKDAIKYITGLLSKDGTDSIKYKIVNEYAKLKLIKSADEKFLNCLSEYMYPGGFIFPSYTQCVNTGRMSCKKPNAQQYSKDITAIVEPRDNYIMFDADYSQIEYRALSGLAQEERLLESFRNPDTDYHTLQASLMYEVPYEEVTKDIRKTAKSLNFGIPYGMGIGSLATNLYGANTEENRKKAEDKRKQYFKNQPKVEGFFNAKKEEARYRHYTETLWHRRRYYDFSNKKSINSTLRQAGNAVVQGTAADIFKISVARNWEFIRKHKLYGKMLISNMVHDEQLIELDCDSLNIDRVVCSIVQNMQFKLDNFPPLYVGGGVERCWKLAKGEGAEMHPELVGQLTAEHITEPVRVDKPRDKYEWLEIYHNRVVQFRHDKVLNYIQDESNWGKKMHPVIASLLLDNFADGLGHEMEEVYNHFTQVNGVNVPYSMFIGKNGEAAEQPDKDEDEPIYDEDEDIVYNIDLDNIQDNIEATIYELVNDFGLIVSNKLGVCGISRSLLTTENTKRLIEYFKSRVTDTGGLRVLVVYSADEAREMGYRVSDICRTEIEQVLKG